MLIHCGPFRMNTLYERFAEATSHKKTEKLRNKAALAAKAVRPYDQGLLQIRNMEFSDSADM